MLLETLHLGREIVNRVLTYFVGKAKNMGKGWFNIFSPDIIQPPNIVTGVQGNKPIQKLVVADKSFFQTATH